MNKVNRNEELCNRQKAERETIRKANNANISNASRD